MKPNKKDFVEHNILCTCAKCVDKRLHKEQLEEENEARKISFERKSSKPKR